MKIKELISKLEKYDEEREIKAFSDYENEEFDITQITEIDRYTDQKMDYVIIYS